MGSISGVAIFTAGRLWDEGKDLPTLDSAAGRTGLSAAAAGPLAGPDGQALTLQHVHPLGRLSDAELQARLAVRPIFVSTSLYEPFGLAVLEAAQAGCPLVLCDIATFRELWDGAAIFFPPGDASPSPSRSATSPPIPAAGRTSARPPGPAPPATPSRP